MKIVVCSSYSFLLVVCFLAVTLAAQDSTGLQARQLYYKSKGASEADQKPAEQKPAEQKQVEQKSAEQKSTKSTAAPAARHRLKTTTLSAEKPTASEPAPLGLKYTIERADASGRYVPVDADQTFSTNDAIRLRMEVNIDAYVYLLSRGASGEGSFLFPQPGEDNRLRAFQPMLQPGESAEPIRFAEPSGTETLYILVSRTPITDLDRMLPARGSGRKSGGTLMASNVPSAQFGDLVGHAEQMQSRDLVRGKVVPVTNTSGSPAGGNTIDEQAIYAVNVSTAASAQVVQKLELRHR